MAFKSDADTIDYFKANLYFNEEEVNTQVITRKESSQVNVYSTVCNLNYFINSCFVDYQTVSTTCEGSYVMEEFIYSKSCNSIDGKVYHFLSQHRYF